MEGLWIMIITTILSRLIFSFLLHLLNYKIIGVFDSMQSDLAKLSNRNRRIIYFAGHGLAMAITVLIWVKFGISYVLTGIILGFGSALVDICFGDSIKI